MTGPARVLPSPVGSGAAPRDEGRTLATSTAPQLDEWREPSPDLDEADWDRLLRGSPNAGATLAARGDSRTRLLFGWLLIGLALRVFLLPLAAHPDLFSVYDRVRLWFEGLFGLDDFGVQTLPMALHGLFVQLSHVAPVDFGGVSWPDPTEDQIFAEARRILSLPGALSALAAWKLPYLVFDLAAAWLLMRVVPRRHGPAVFALWMVHPVLLYVTGVFGKYEALMLVPLLVGLGDVRHGRLERGFLWVGVACAMRVYPLMLLPAMALAASGGARRRIELMLLGSLPLALVVVIGAWGTSWAWLVLPAAAFGACRGYAALRRTRAEWLLSCGLVAGSVLAWPAVYASLWGEQNPVTNLFHHASFLAVGPFGSGSPDRLLLFPLAWIAVLAWSHHLAARRPGHVRCFDDVADAALLSALAFFSLAYFHPQYTALLIVLVLARLHRLRHGVGAHALQVVGLLLLVLSFHGGNATVRLFLPLAPDAVLDLPTPLAVLPASLAALPWAGVGRTLLLLAAAWIVLDLHATRRGVSQGLQARPLRTVAWWGSAASWPATVGLYLVLTAQFEPPPRQQAAPATAAVSEQALVRMFAADAEGRSAEVFRSLVPRDVFRPGAGGEVRVPLREVPTLAGGEYTFVVELDSASASVAAPSPVLVERGATTLARADNELRERLFAARAGTLRAWWLGVPVLSLVAGLSLLATQRRRSSRSAVPNG